MKTLALMVAMALGCGSTSSDFPIGQPDSDPHEPIACGAAWHAPAVPPPEPSQCERACAPMTSEDGGPCAKATTPNLSATHDCTGTFAFGSTRGCCVVHQLTSGVEDAWFYACPG